MTHRAQRTTHTNDSATVAAREARGCEDEDENNAVCSVLLPGMRRPAHLEGPDD